MRNPSRKVCLCVLFIVSACTTLPDPVFEKFDFPKDKAFINDSDRPYEKLGVVKTKVNYPTLDPNHDEEGLCKNYYNKAVANLLKQAKKKGGDAIVKIRSAVFYEDGTSKLYETPECSDDGQEGQILLNALAVKWKPEVKAP